MVTMEGPDAGQQAKRRPPSDPGGAGNTTVTRGEIKDADEGTEDEPQEAKGQPRRARTGAILTTGREQCTRQGVQDQEASGQAWGAEEAVSPIRNYHRNVGRKGIQTSGSLEGNSGGYFLTSVPVNHGKTPLVKRRFPKLNGEESAHLLKFLEEACVVDNCKYEKWRDCAIAITHDLLNTPLAFTTVLGSMTRKGKRAMAPVLNRGRKNQAGRPDPTFYVQPECVQQSQLFEQLRAVCTQEEVLREGTEDEWQNYPRTGRRNDRE
ncbi:hypothetical protein GQ600_27149 [Phytophthora cactorum]|nr:hypothetical protein GQ600_27149 [Phytophthora cactorum]